MNSKEFREKGHEMVDYVADYFDSLHLRRVTSNVPPGHLISSMPQTAPNKGESFQKIMDDVEKYIMPSLTHWKHPGFHGCFPSNGSLSAILGIMFADTFGYVGFNWDASPSGSELEMIILDWLGEMLGLPSEFLRCSSAKAAASIQKSTSECIFIAMITVRQNVLSQMSNRNPAISKAALLSLLVVYCSNESYFNVQNAARVSLMTLKVLDVDESFRLKGETLAKAIQEDKKLGLVPVFVCTTIGSTCGAWDPIDEIGPICKAHDIWLHVNASYAGAATICPEYKHLLKGIEYASSYNINLAKWMLVDSDCCVMFVKDRFKIVDTITADKTVFGYTFSEKDWGHPGKTEFRAMKLWFVFRLYGVKGLQNHIRNHIRLAKMFESLVKSDERFELVICNFGLVCFRIIGTDRLNQYLLHAINYTGEMFLIPLRLNGKYVIRFVVCREHANEDDITRAWNQIRQHADELLQMNLLQRKTFYKGRLLNPYEYSIP